jgi:hypothetical protein
MFRVVHRELALSEQSPDHIKQIKKTRPHFYPNNRGTCFQLRQVKELSGCISVQYIYSI